MVAAPRIYNIRARDQRRGVDYWPDTTAELGPDSSRELSPALPPPPARSLSFFLVRLFVRSFSVRLQLCPTSLIRARPLGGFVVPRIFDKQKAPARRTRFEASAKKYFTAAIIIYARARARTGEPRLQPPSTRPRCFPEPSRSAVSAPDRGKLNYVCEDSFGRWRDR